MGKLKITIMPVDHIASYVTNSLTEQLEGKPDSVLGMTTGNTPLTTGIYKEWIQRAQSGKIDFSNTVWINPDEQLGIAKEHPESYYSYMRKHCLDHIPNEPKAWYIPDGTARNPEAECVNMESAIEAHGGVDWQLMGIGINGHICFIEPNSAIPSKCYVTHIAEVNRQLYAQYFGSVESVPTHAVTYGLGTVLKCRSIKMVAVGAGKADIVAQALTNSISTELPATFLQLHENIEYILDPSAAASLPKDIDQRYEVSLYKEEK